MLTDRPAGPGGRDPQQLRLRRRLMPHRGLAGRSTALSTTRTSGGTSATGNSWRPSSACSTAPPFKSPVWRLAGVRIGRRVFDDGCSIAERVDPRGSTAGYPALSRGLVMPVGCAVWCSLVPARFLTDQRLASRDASTAVLGCASCAERTGAKPAGCRKRGAGREEPTFGPGKRDFRPWAGLSRPCSLNMSARRERELDRTNCPGRPDARRDG